MLAITLLGIVLLAGLIAVPLGLPGLWVMLGGALLYWILVPLGGIGFWTIVTASVLVVIAEILEFSISGKYARRFGGSKRASWGAIIGGIVGAIIGVPLPVIGSLIGAFAGAFAGAFLAELTVAKETRGDPTRVATGALVGRAVAAATKVGIGLVVAVLVLSVAVAG
ncbi:MAG: DUF456 domain-containing protein [Gemmatimonadota bacterium]